MFLYLSTTVWNNWTARANAGTFKTGRSFPSDSSGNRYRLMMGSFENLNLAVSYWLFRTAQCLTGFVVLMSPWPFWKAGSGCKDTEQLWHTSAAKAVFIYNKPMRGTCKFVLINFYFVFCFFVCLLLCGEKNKTKQNMFLQHSFVFPQ